MAKTRIRDDKICGVGPWVWLESDDGAWDGPSKEFQLLANTMLKHARKRDLVLCAGACQGMYPRLFAEVSGFTTVVGVEPCPDSFAVFEQNCPDNRRYVRINAALGNEAGRVRLFRPQPSNVGMNHIVDRGGEDQIDVGMVRVDDLALEALDVLQLDAEGSESLVLLGAEQSIVRFRPVISIETINDVSYALLERLGYEEVGRCTADTVFAPR